jgi:hypothetical protein
MIYKINKLKILKLTADFGDNGPGLGSLDSD